jgi:sialate O-acetylesterase
MRQRFPLLCLVSLVLFCAAGARAEVKPNSLFSDNAVLQQGISLPVWGTAREGEPITVDFAGQRVSTVARGGKWLVRLRPLAVNDLPTDLIIHGDNVVTVKNIVVGEVWVASGQSNMERQLGPRGGQPEIDHWKEEVASANYPLIREYYVPEVLSPGPKTDVNSQWTVCSPQTVKDFTAVGYFFARDLFKAKKVPVGILFTAWGGTVAEAWTSAASLKSMPEFRPAIQAVEAAAAPAPGATGDLPTQFAAWYAKNDPGSKAGQEWSASLLSTADWQTTAVPWTYPDSFDGVMWLRKEINLPPAWAGKAATLDLGPIDDMDTTWVNGVLVGRGDSWQLPRHYPVPAGLLKAGRNVIAIRALDTGGVGGLMGSPDAYQLVAADPGAPAPLPLAGPWLTKLGFELKNASPLPGSSSSSSINPNTATVLFNSMIAPLLPFPIRGVIWYQGESNQDRAQQYRTLFPLMIADWRKDWGIGNFPFLFVQIAPFNGMRPEIREAQFLTLQKSPNTAMAVTTDIGDANNIHPAHKEPVGARLALAARALAYGERIEYSGPLYQSMRTQGSRVTLTFTHIGDGLVAKDGALKGFTVAGPDGKFVPAQAEIQGSAVVVSSPQVPNPTAVRYGWDFVPDVNLFNSEGLPASPFRTDDGPPTTRADDSHSKQFTQWYAECAERVAAAKGKPVDIIFIGDSITQNFIEVPKNGWNLVGKVVWDRYYAHRNALNFGVGADGTQHMLWRLENMDVKGFRPKVAVILAGINNAEDTAEDIAAGVKAVITKTLAVFPGVKIISVAILPNGRAPEKMARANEIIRTFADNRTVFSLDLSSRMPPMGDGWKGIGGDKVHVTEEGYQIWASAMEPLLTSLLPL